jgi:mono/diheme cytochrome c family protein
MSTITKRKLVQKFQRMPFFIGVLLLAGCNYMHMKVSDQGVTDAELSYDWASANVFKPYCVSCHGGTAPSDDIDLNTYANVMASHVVIPYQPGTSLAQNDLDSGRMPKGKPQLDATTRQNFSRWIALGAPEHPGSAPPPPPPPPPAPTPTYAYINQYMIQPYCIGCHNSNVDPTTNKPHKPKGGVDLGSISLMLNSDTSDVVDPESSDTSLLWQVLFLKKMPPKSTPATFPFSKEQVQAVADWINQWVNNGNTK